LPPVIDKLRCRMLSTELKRLQRILFEPSKIADKRFLRRPVAEIWRFATDFLRPTTRYYVALLAVVSQRTNLAARARFDGQVG